MANRKKESAKFFTGFASAQIIFHWGIGLFNANLPLDFGFIALTEGLNTFSIVFWPIILVFSMYYGWIKKIKKK
ncbi:hypothetical protein RM549_13945 [Salegentibacter sp. F188]|uniref:Uncharacterized protein n=2 Tax=Autumnicola TaxID=3160927 RepID=A0ABU3E4G5_9FLAO|nr:MULTISPECIES: hypothetical protein [Flavobacteriaceae]MDT0687369.1 hypothetical protein [Zunongwangia sp. F225]MDT0690896.1 hypothetical protein [Salegentibacter sp. F188]